jgi:SAM-dependent methyltransferase
MQKGFSSRRRLNDIGDRKMPKLTDTLHLDMLKSAIRNRQPESDGLYGLHWGDPEKHPALMVIRDKWLRPYVRSDHSAIEIGPGGGRWTRYMLPFHRIYAVDYHQELLEELKKHFSQPNIVFIKNNGTDFPGIAERSVDFLYSFGVFVHLDTDIIRDYLLNIRKVLKPSGNAIIQYSGKDKQAAIDSKGFSENNPRIMRKLLSETGYIIVEEDTKLLWHSSIVRFTYENS